MNLPQFLVLFVLAPILAQPVLAAEPWADAKLPVTTGLQLWLDAGRATGGQPAPTDPKLDRWMDASGHGRHLLQPNADARPTRLAVAGVAVARFDGVDDHLRAVKQGASLESFSVVLVAVP